MTDIPILLTDNNAPSVDMYAMECTLEVSKREVLNGAEKSSLCKWSGYASLEVVTAMRHTNTKGGGAMTDNRTTELLCCPFCGGEAFIVHFTQDACYVKCENHDCMAGQKVYPTKAEAIAAWNARAERTCKPQGEWERMSQTQEIRHIYCECGEYFGADERDSFPFAIETKAFLPNYCPNCGARVIEEKGKGNDGK